MTPETARSAYEVLSNTGRHFGPFVLYDHAAWSRVKSIYQAIAEDNGGINRAGQGVFEAASPWHAYFFLQSLLPELQPGSVTKFLYRGQSNPAKPLATLYRPGVNPEDTTTCFRLFKSYLDLLAFPYEEFFSETQLWLMARHHGLPTAHLDFTADPAVALFFAGSGGNVDGYSRVFVANLHTTLQWARLWVPPTAAQRLYRQRGVLLEIPECQYHAFHGGLVEVRFPWGHPFAVWRDGRECSLFPSNSLDNIFELAARAALAEQDFVATNVLGWRQTLELLSLSSGKARVEALMWILGRTGGPMVEALVWIFGGRARRMAGFLSRATERLNLEQAFEGCFDDWAWMQWALLPSRLRLTAKGLDLDVDMQVARALCRDNRWTYEELLAQSRAEPAFTSSHAPWVGELVEKVRNAFFEAAADLNGARES